MSSLMNAAIHLGPNYVSNSEIHKNTKFEEIESLFNITQIGIKEHSEEILNVRSLDYSSPSWTRSTVVIDEATKFAKAKACVYVDSVLCVGRMEQEPGATERWKGQVEDPKKCSSYQDAVEIDGEAIEFEEKNIPGFSKLSVLQEIQEDLAGNNIQPEEFKDRIIIMSMFNDTDWKKRMMRIAFRMPRKSRITR